MFSKVLIANRGEIACRIIRTLERLGIGSVAVYSEADRDSQHVSLADEAYRIGAGPVSESYLDQECLLEIARSTGAEAIHPGYGLLSESPEFAETCEARGIRFIGPTPGQMRAFALKHKARELATVAEVPLLPGSGVLSSLEHAAAAAEDIGYPVILKSSGGGGGIGMAVCSNADELATNYEKVARLARTNFSSDEVFLERFVVDSRHIEVQAFGDGRGDIMVLGERDCSVQRRNQKVIEETPAPGISDWIRKALSEAAIQLLEQVNYRSAGTVEFLYDANSDQFYFLEVNTRLQVEHGVTEAVTGIDVVEMMVRVAAGQDPVPGSHVRKTDGHAIEARIYAEDPHKNFQPSSGLITNVSFPENVRVDTWISAGIEVSPFYDPLLAKVIVHAPTRREACRALWRALKQTRIDGIATNIEYLAEIAGSHRFQEGTITTRFLNDFQHIPDTLEVIVPGTQTTVQDYPGRTGYWEVGVPPSGPMDSLAFRLGNRIVGNAQDAAGLEMTMSGATIRFHTDTVIALTGADMAATLGDDPAPQWQAITIRAGTTLRMATVHGPGARAYLAIRGGLDVPVYLGSRSTFGLGQFGGHGGRSLLTGDVLHIGNMQPIAEPVAFLDPTLVPQYKDCWDIGVLYGPHGAPEFFEVSYLAEFLDTDWEVHFNSARTGIRLIGPKPGWARPDGGEAGLHPSNIHDTPYAIGAIDFTGDMPVILGPDGPSLGGFVCPFTIIESELWKLGQLSAGDSVRFYLLTAGEADIRISETDEAISELSAPAYHPPMFNIRLQDCDTILIRDDKNADRPAVVYRSSGDRNLLIEYGPPNLDIGLRLKVHQVYQALQSANHKFVIDVTPGVRSLQIHFDRSVNSRQVVEYVRELDAGLPDLDEVEVASRVVHLPLSWDDPSTREAIDKYQATVRKDAPWYPSNIEFIRRINGLESIEEVQRVVFDASYVVLGLGDVYLGAPVATPLDPRHRLVTTKYNPARTWTPENAVGIGGAYLCIYGMEGPGGYQFVGRTVQMWNRYRTTSYFEAGKPWLLRFFDQIRFSPVTTEELTEIRHAFVRGGYRLDIEETTFRLRDYEKFLAANAESFDDFRTSQRHAFDDERQRWADSGAEFDDVEVHIDVSDTEEAPPGTTPIESSIAGNMWKVLVAEGDVILADQDVAIVESMKMEMSIASPLSGKIRKIICAPGTPVRPGQAIMYIESA